MTNAWFLYLFFSLGLIGAGIYALLATGFARGNVLLAQALVVTYIVIEVSVVATALALIINVYQHTKSLDIRKLAKLKG